MYFSHNISNYFVQVFSVTPNNENIELEKYKNDIENYKKQIENLKKEKNKYVSFCAKGIITETELKNFINELEPNILFLIREIKTLE